MPDKIICRINDSPKIFIKINDIPKILVRFGEQGLRGASGLNSDHSLLLNLDYDNSNHTGFQRKLIFIPEYHAYEVE